MGERYDAISTRFSHAGGFARGARVDAVLEGLGFDEAARSRSLSSFSGGWLMRVELAKLLLAGPDVLLLDEPTNHLDIESIIWLEGFLGSFPGALVITSHDREFLNRVVTKIVEIDGGELRSFSGNYDF